MSPFEKRYRPEYAVELLEIARGDLESAEALASTGRGRPENVAYLAHQAVEKALKAVCCARGKAILHTRDIEALLVTLPIEIARPPNEERLKPRILRRRPFPELGFSSGYRVSMLNSFMSARIAKRDSSISHPRRSTRTTKLWV